MTVALTRVGWINVVLVVVFAAMVLVYVEPVRERLMPPLYDDLRSFSRIEPRPGWTDTGIVVRENEPIGIVASGRVSTPRLKRAIAADPDKPFDVGPDGADVPEAQIPDWRELDRFPAFALVGRIDGGKPFLVGRRTVISTAGRLELKINCPLWDKRVLDEPDMVGRRRRSPLSATELEHLRMIRGFFGYRTWRLGTAEPRAPHLPPTATEIAARYGAIAR
jgi:hypothetical protein